MKTLTAIKLLQTIQAKPGKTTGIYCISGENTFLKDQIVSSIKKSFGQQWKFFNADSELSSSDFRSYLSGQPDLFCSTPNRSRAAIIYGNGIKQPEWKKLLKGINLTKNLLLVIDGSVSGHDAVAIKCVPFSSNEAQGMLKQVAAKEKITLPDNLEMCINYWGTDLSHIERELAKLSLVVPQGQKITLEAIKKYTEPKDPSDIFGFSSEIGRRKFSKAIYKFREAYEASPSIMLHYANTVSLFRRTALAYEKSSGELCRIFHAPLFVCQEYRNFTSNYTKAQIAKILILLTDQKESVLYSDRPEDIFECLIWQISVI